jgi:hypothetical protein
MEAVREQYRRAAEDPDVAHEDMAKAAARIRRPA